MAKKYYTARYKMPKYKGNSPSTGMSDEKFLAFIDRDILSSLILTFGGLLFSYNGMRGFPIPWTDGEHASIIAFLSSFAVITVIVVILDIITSAVRRSSEPSAEEKYSSYTKNQVFSSYPTDDQVKYYEVNSSKTSAVRETKRTSTKSEASSKSYESKMADDYEKLKTTVLKPMLNGQQPVTRRSSGRNAGKEKSKSPIAAILITCISLIMISSISGLIGDEFSDDFPFIDEGPEYAAEDDDSFDQSPLAEESEVYLQNLFNGYVGEIVGEGEDDSISISSYADWNNGEWYQMFEGIQGNDAVLRYGVLVDESDEYVFAFKFTGDDPDMGEGDLTGLMICPMDSWSVMTDSVPEGALSVGDTEIDDVSILVWE